MTTLGRKSPVALAALAAALAAPAAAPADVIVSTDGTTMVIEGSPGESNEIFVLYAPATDVHGVVDQPNGVSETSPLCTTGFLSVSCTGITAIRVEAGDRDDMVSLDPAGAAVSPIVPSAVLGEDGDDLLRGGTAGVSLDGGVGEDVLLGRGGNDLLRGGPDADLLQGAAGDDSLAGDAGADILRGGDGDDQLLGGPGADFLRGEAGDDLLRGDPGADVLLGEGGIDALNAKDRARDRLIHCGGGKDRRAKRDRLKDPKAKSCAPRRRRR